jgi:hypothetical protein
VPLDTATVANNKNAKIQNLWNKTVDRVRKDFHEFPRLSFNKLRKTASNMVRGEAGAEVASLMLAHGEASEDDLLDLYTNRPFQKLHSTLYFIESRLARLWEAIPDPFPNGPEKKGGANISRAKIQRILDLSGAGLTVPEIARRMKVGTETVRRWVKRGMPE